MSSGIYGKSLGRYIKEDSLGRGRGRDIHGFCMFRPTQSPLISIIKDATAHWRVTYLYRKTLTIR